MRPKLRVLFPFLLGAVLVGATAAAPAPPPSTAAWLEEVAPLLTAHERAAYLALSDDAARAAFARRFWEMRDPYPETARNEAEERWAARLAEARQRFGGLADPRARALLLAGEPERAFTASCPGGPALEVWFYRRTSRLESELPLYFVAGPEGGAPRLFRRAEGGDLAAVTRAPEAGCEPLADLTTMYTWMRLIGSAYDSMLERALSAPPPPADEWLASFAPVSTDVPSGAPTLEGDLAVAFPGRVPGGTLMRGVITVPFPTTLPPPVDPAALAEAAADTSATPEAPRRGPVERVRDFLLTGQVMRARQILETFRYVFRVAAPEGEAAERVPLAFERQLPPGQYTLVVRLQDVEGGSFLRREREVEVPAAAPGAAAAAAPPAPRDLPSESSASAVSPAVLPPEPGSSATSATSAAAALAALAPAIASQPSAAPDGTTSTPRQAEAPAPDPFAEANAGLGGDDGPSVHLAAPHGSLLFGETRFAAQATPGVERVAFLLDGRQLLVRNRAPFEVRLDLGPAPRPHTVEAEALDADGRTVASDRLAVNAGAERFAVRLAEPRAGRSYGRSLRASAEVHLPPGRSLDRLELYWNETRVATLYQSPWSLPIALPSPGAVGYVRAVAYLPDGATTEDIVQVNAPGFGGKVDVRLVELYTTVCDRTGRPVDGLAAERFQVQEDGVPQQVRRFERVRDLPLAAGLLLDTSGSMASMLPEVRQAASAFLATLTPKDRAALLTFNRGPRLEVPLTGDRDVLGQGLATLVAQGETTLYDSVIFGLRTLADAPGQRALLLLSDGEERGSAFTFEQALEVAHRSGVTLYAIGLGAKESEARKRLARLAEDTGGRAFFPKAAADLAPIYAEIERELRVRYLLAYESSHGEAGADFRRVQVELGDKGLEARTISGYYP